MIVFCRLVNASHHPGNVIHIGTVRMEKMKDSVTLRALHLNSPVQIQGPLLVLAGIWCVMGWSNARMVQMKVWAVVCITPSYI